MNQSSEATRHERIEAAEFGGRQPVGRARGLLLGTSLGWALFQLWVASPLPFLIGLGVFNSTEIRSIHLAFAIFLAYLSFPSHRGRIVHEIPWFDWLLASLAALSAGYLFLFYSQLAERAGAPTVLDIWVAVAGVLLLLEATRRALGWPLTLIAFSFLCYSLAGPWLPELLAHKGASLERLASHQWLSTEGVFGVAVGVSAGFDGYMEDRLLGLKYTLDGYYQCGKRLRDSFDHIFAVLEGGYHMDIKKCVEHFIRGVNQE